MSVTLAMDGNYPDIYSGSITFLNTRTEDKVSLTMPKDVESGVYEIRSITMDTGASATIIPEKFGERLGIEDLLLDKENIIFFLVLSEPAFVSIRLTLSSFLFLMELSNWKTVFLAFALSESQKTNYCSFKARY